MERIKSRTSTVNRCLNFSSYIYTVENLNTFAEINNTTEENVIPIGSRIRVRLIGVTEMWNIAHSARINCWRYIITIVGIILKIHKAHRNILAKLNSKVLRFIIL